jgi:hypothetical protein
VIGTCHATLARVAPPRRPLRPSPQHQHVLATLLLALRPYAPAAVATTATLTTSCGRELPGRAYDGEVEAAYSLADILIGTEDPDDEGFFYLRRAISALPQAIRSGGVAPDVARCVFRLLQMVVQHTADPIALMAAWSHGDDSEPVLTMSAVDLAKVQSFERLADLVAAGFFVALMLTPELPEDDPTILQRLLTTGSSRHAASAEREVMFLQSQATPRKVPAAVGRNRPCPCGSGKKYKRCCARPSAD